jgi:hypothetical protein
MMFAAQIFVEKRSYDSWIGWSEWAPESFDQDPSVEGIVSAISTQTGFNHLPDGGLIVEGDTPFYMGGAGEDAELEARFTLQRPVACQVVYRVDEVTNADPSVTTEGGEQTVNVLPNSPQTISVSGTAAAIEVLYILGLRWHPWA